MVTVEAFRRALRALDPGGTIRREIGRLPAQDTTAIAEVTARVRARIAGAPLPGDVRDQIVARYRGLGGDPGAGESGGVPVAVRSSATGEDDAETSFAGLQDTYLWVRGADAVIDHVRRCWASLYNAEAVGYRLRMKITEQDLAMAVVVQRMVEPRCAGVMFTCSPVTGDRSVIAVEGCWGLGSALVGGDVTPDSFVVSKVTGEIVRRQVAAKLRLHRAGPGGAGVAAADVPGPLQEVRLPPGRGTRRAGAARGTGGGPLRRAAGHRVGDHGRCLPRRRAWCCCRAGPRRSGPAAAASRSPRPRPGRPTTSSSSLARST